MLGIYSKKIKTLLTLKDDNQSEKIIEKRFSKINLTLTEKKKK